LKIKLHFCFSFALPTRWPIMQPNRNVEQKNPDIFTRQRRTLLENCWVCHYFLSCLWYWIRIWITYKVNANKEDVVLVKRLEYRLWIKDSQYSAIVSCVWVVIKENQSHFRVLNKFFNFNFILPKVNTDYIRQAQVLNIDNLRLIIYLWKFNKNIK